MEMVKTIIEMMSLILDICEIIVKVNYHLNIIIIYSLLLKLKPIVFCSLSLNSKQISHLFSMQAMFDFASGVSLRRSHEHPEKIKF